mgnify:CR=1 FL=1
MEDKERQQADSSEEEEKDQGTFMSSPQPNTLPGQDKVDEAKRIQTNNTSPGVDDAISTTVAMPDGSQQEVVPETETETDSAAAASTTMTTELEDVPLVLTRVESTDAKWELDDATEECRMSV